MKILVTYLLFLLYCVSSLQSIIISSCAKWNTTGITVAGTGTPGSEAQQLSFPQGIFVHDKKRLLYVSDTFNDRIQVFPLDQSTKVGTTLLSQLSGNYKIYVDDDDDDFPTIYIAMNGAHQVIKWSKGADIGIQVGAECRRCTGVWLDKEKNVYMSEHDRYRIRKWSSATNLTTTVAGEVDKKGSRADHLNEPQGVFVDSTTETVYVADLLNHRIQAWEKNAKEGRTVSGSSEGDPGSDAKSLDRPYGLRVDETTKVIYVADLMNNRIQRWKHESIEGETIVGGNGQGIGSDQLYHPTDLAFDSDGNLYVSEGQNHRVQFFALLDNSPCYQPSPSTARSSSSKLPMSSSSLLLMISFVLIVKIRY